MRTFGDRLKEARKNCKLTQRALAVLCDTDEATIRSYEKGRKAPGKSMMLRIFNALKTPPDFFFQDELNFAWYKNKSDLIANISGLKENHYKLVQRLVENLLEIED